VGFTEAKAKEGIPAGYVLVGIDNVASYDFDDTADQTITVHVGHVHTQSEVTVSRTIHYQGAGIATPDDVVQPITWLLDRDEHTKVVTYSSGADGYDEVISPVLDGYTIDVGLVGASSVASASGVAPVSTTVLVTYSPSVQRVDVVYVDDDNGYSEVTPVAGTETSFTGPSGSLVGYTEAKAKAGVPAGYVFVGLDNVTTFDYVDAVDQVITVHLREAHSQSVVTVTRTIHYQGADSSTPDDVTQTVTWGVDKNQVTGEVVYTTTSPGFEAVTTPRVDGYTVDVLEVREVPAVSPTKVAPVSTTVLVTYAPSRQTVHVVYVDDDADGDPVTPVEGTVTTFTGTSGSPVRFTEDMAKAGIPSGYVFVKLDNVASYDFADAQDQTIMVHLVEAHAQSEMTTTRTVHYLGAGKATPPDVVQPITWSIDTNQITGAAIYTATSPGFDAVTTPAIDGYQAGTARVEFAPVNSPTNTPPTSSVVPVLYTPSTQRVNVIYVDDEQGGEPVTPAAGAVTTLTGPSGSSVGYTEATAKAGVPAGYVYVGLENVTSYDFADAKDQTIIVHLNEARSQYELLVTRTIIYQGAGTSTPPDVVQKTRWTVTSNQATGTVEYTTADPGFVAVTTPVIDGYKADIDTVPAPLGASASSVAPVSTTVTVTFTPTLQQVHVLYIDDDSGTSVTPVNGAVTMLSGLSGTTVGFTEASAKAGIPAGYVLLGLDNVTSYDFANAQDQYITVRLGQAHTQSQISVARTIHYQGAGRATPNDVVQPITWSIDINQVTGSVEYTCDATGYAGVETPHIDGFTVDITEVPAAAVVSPTNLAPVSTTILVTYEHSVQTVNVVFIDDDAGAEVPPNPGTVTTLTGPSGALVGYTENYARLGIPAGYMLAGLDNVARFNFADAQDQTIVVHLTEEHSITDVAVSRTIRYVGAGAATPDDVVQTIHWSVDVNQITSVMTFTADSEGYDAVETPRIPGYVADILLADAQSVVSPTNVAPVASTVIVTYTAEAPILQEAPPEQTPQLPAPQIPEAPGAPGAGAGYETGGTVHGLSPLWMLLVLIQVALGAALLRRASLNRQLVEN